MQVEILLTILPTDEEVAAVQAVEHEPDLSQPEKFMLMCSKVQGHRCVVSMQRVLLVRRDSTG